jgi:hypothetical protein
MKRNTNKTARYRPFSLAPSLREFLYWQNHRIRPLWSPSDTPSNEPTSLNFRDNSNQPPATLTLAPTKHHNATKQMEKITANQLG